MFSVILLVFSLNSASVAADFATVADLEQGLARLTQTVAKTPGRAAKAALLNDFHQGLRTEIRKRADASAHDDFYWRAIDLDQTLTTILDGDCGELRKTLIRQDQEAFGDADGTLSAETHRAIELVSRFCGK